MNEQLRLLIETQALDTTILQRQKLIMEIPAQISAMEKPLAIARASLDAQRKKVETAEKKRHLREGDIEEINARIEKQKSRTGDIKTNKEYQAMLKEIDVSEQEIYSIEEEILTLMETVEEENARMKVAGAALEEQEKKADELKAELAAQVREAEGGLDELKAQRNKLADTMEEDHYDIYMDLLQSTGGRAVTEARAERCLGCNMNIMPQLFVGIKKNEDVNYCPQCHRILYFKEEIKEDAKEDSVK